VSAIELLFRQLLVRLCLLQRGGGAGDFRFIRARIDRDQHVTLFDDAAFRKAHAVDEP